MSLTFDYITMPPKSHEASQIQTQEITRMNNEQQELGTQFQEHIKKNSEQTIRRTKAENEELKNEERERREKKKKKKEASQQKDASSSSNKESDKKTMSQESHFDIRI